MPDRYFVDEPILGQRATLRGAEAHHLLHVMRAKPGAIVTLFDGAGAEFSAQVAELARDRVELSIVERRNLDRELSVHVTLGVALPKGDRQRWLVEKAVELGLSQLVALDTSRSVSKAQPSALDRLRRTTIEASKQCGRNRLMVVSAADWSSFLNEAPEVAAKYIAHPGATTSLSSLPTPTFAADKPIVAAVGPEGGFTEDEVSLAVSRGWQLLDLGPRVLRTETAALAIASLAGLGHLAPREGP